MAKIDILTKEELEEALIPILELLQNRQESNLIAQNDEIPRSLKELSVVMGVSVKTLSELIRSGVLPRRQFKQRGYLMLYPSDLKKALEKPKSS